MANPSVLHDDGSKTGTAASANIQPTNAPTAGNFAVVNISQAGSSSAETVADTAGNTWTKQSSAVTSNNNVASQWTATLSSVAGSPYKIQLTGMATLGTPWAINFQEIINYNTGSPIDGTPTATNYANAASTTFSVSVGTASNPGDLAICVNSYNTAETTTPTAPLSTTTTDNSLSSPMWVGTATITGTGAVTLAGTLNNTTRKATCGILIAAQATAPAMPISGRGIFVGS